MPPRRAQQPDSSQDNSVPDVAAEPDASQQQMSLTPVQLLDALQSNNAAIQQQFSGFMQAAHAQFQAQLDQVRADARQQAQLAAEALDEQRRAQEEDRRGAATREAALQASINAARQASDQQTRDFLQAVQQQQQENQQMQHLQQQQLASHTSRSSSSGAVRPPPAAPSIEGISALDSTEPDPPTLAMKHRALRKSIELRVRTYGSSLAYHYKAIAETFSVGNHPGDRFPNADARSAFAARVFITITELAVHMFKPNSTGAPWVPGPVDTANIPVQANTDFLVTCHADSLRMFEEFVFTTLHVKVSPQATQLRLQTYEREVHTSIWSEPTARGSHALYDCDQNFDAFDKFMGMRMQLQLFTFKSTGNETADLRDRESLRMRVNTYYSDANGNLDHQRKDNEAAVAMIIKDEQNPELFQELRKMITKGDHEVSTPELVTRFIRRWKQGAATLPPSMHHEAMMMTANIEQVVDTAMERLQAQMGDMDPFVGAAIRRVMCAQCGQLDDHPTSMCTKAPCLYENCRRGAGKGHTPECPRFTAWSKAQQGTSKPQ